MRLHKKKEAITMKTSVMAEGGAGQMDSKARVVETRQERLKTDTRRPPRGGQWVRKTVSSPRGRSGAATTVAAAAEGTQPPASEATATAPATIEGAAATGEAPAVATTTDASQEDKKRVEQTARRDEIIASTRRKYVEAHSDNPNAGADFDQKVTLLETSTDVSAIVAGQEELALGYRDLIDVLQANKAGIGEQELSGKIDGVKFVKISDALADFPEDMPAEIRKDLIQHFDTLFGTDSTVDQQAEAILALSKFGFGDDDFIRGRLGYDASEDVIRLVAEKKKLQGEMQPSGEEPAVTPAPIREGENQEDGLEEAPLDDATVQEMQETAKQVREDVDTINNPEKSEAEKKAAMERLKEVWEKVKSSKAYRIQGNWLKGGLIAAAIVIVPIVIPTLLMARLHAGGGK